MNPSELQRLVDGEMSYPERRRLLLKLDEGNSSNQWRSIALAFIEDQAFRSALAKSVLAKSVLAKSVLAKSALANEKISDKSVFEALCVTEDSSREQSPPPSKPTPLPSSDRHDNSHWKRYLNMFALAASFLVIGWIGAILSTNETEQESMKLAVDTPQPKMDPSANSVYSNLKPVGNLEIMTASDSPNNASSKFEMPVYEVRSDQAEDLLNAQEQAIAQMKQEYRRRGYELRAKPRFIESQTPDGRPLLVPAHQFEIMNVTY